MSEKKDWKKVREEHEVELPEAKINEEEASVAEDFSAALEHPSYAILEEKLTEAEQKSHENWEKAVRAQAELDNVQRRAEREIANAHRYGAEKFAESLLPVLDSLNKALEIANNHEDSSMSEGIELIKKQFLSALEKNNIQEIDPLNAPFNPQEHEAMSMIETPDAKSNTVISVFQKGYKLYDRIIRAARVVVAK